MGNPYFSIITVTLNAGKFIENSIDSVLNQNMTDYEHIIFDGGSSDNTLEIIAGKKQDRIRLIQGKDKGIYDAMNQAIGHAKGVFCYFLNAGDMLYNEYTLENLKNIPEMNEAGLISGWVKTCNDPSGISLLSGKSLQLSSFYFDIPVSHQGALIRRDMFEKLGLYNLQYSVVADQEWFIRFFLQKEKKYIFSPQIFAWYETVGFSFRNRIKGLKQMLAYNSEYFPWYVVIFNYLRFPVLVGKVKLIQLMSESNIYRSYRKFRYGKA